MGKKNYNYKSAIRRKIARSDQFFMFRTQLHEKIVNTFLFYLWFAHTQ